MCPDVKLKDYYVNFILNAKTDIIKYNNKIKLLQEERQKLFDYIVDNKDYYYDNFNIKLNNYTKEIIEKTYNTERTLINKCNVYIKDEIDSTKRIYLYKLISYCNVLYEIHNLNTMIALANKRKNIKPREYQRLIGKYYKQVHKEILQGFGYKFNYGIGIFCICRWKVNDTKSNNQKLDYYATNKNKKELLAKGKKLFNPIEAKWYADRNIPYDGIDYRVYKKVTHLYDINIIRSKLFTYRNHIFEHAEYVKYTLRGKSYTDMANECETLDDIVNYPVDIRYKLNMWLYKDPSNYILYIRNNEQDRFESGKSYC